MAERHPRILYLEGSMGSGKTQTLTQRALEILTTESANQLLILCSNHFRQQQLIQTLLHQLETPTGQLPVYTFAGLVRNTLFDFWPLVESRIQALDKDNSAIIRPVLSGLEDSEFILSALLDDFRQQAGQLSPQALFEGFKGSDRALVKQLIRRCRLRSENALSRTQMSERSQQIQEQWQTETAEIERRFDRMAYLLRALDSNKQIDVFLSLLQAEKSGTPSFLMHYFQNKIQHLIVDDFDESTPAQQNLIQQLIPSLQTLTMACDPDGGSRRGYLNAYPDGWVHFKKQFPGETILFERQDPIYQAGQSLLNNWLHPDTPQTINNTLQLNDSAMSRSEMLDDVIEEINQALNAGHTPGEITLVIPKSDFFSVYKLERSLQQRGIPVQLLTGTQRLYHRPIVQALIHLIQLTNQKQLQISLLPWEIRGIFYEIFKVPVSACEAVDTFIQQFLSQGLTEEWPLWEHFASDPKDTLQQSNQLSLSNTTEDLPPDIPITTPLYLSDTASDSLQHAYETLRSWIQTHKTHHTQDQLYAAFNELIAPHATQTENHQAIQRLIDSYERQYGIAKKMQTVSSPETGEFNRTKFDLLWLRHIKLGAVADTTDLPDAPNPEAIVIATPQKIIDFEIRRNTQYWLDISSREWCRTDDAPLYNSWAHSRYWEHPEIQHALKENESEQQAQLVRLRAAHLTRTLLLLCQGKVIAYSSLLDDTGFTQQGLLPEQLLLSEEALPNLTPLPPITLRVDQSPILNYTGGTMAVTAVPGAGKTFVNVALVLKLVESGIDGTPIEPSKILVLTYMDSAAQTLLARLKPRLQAIGKRHSMPSVSTIHSLAFRILTENNHAIRLGYDPNNLSVLDEFQQDDLLLNVARQTMPASVSSDMIWRQSISRGIKHAKMRRLSPEALSTFIQNNPGQFRLAEFLPAYQLYQTRMQEEGWLDFDDLIFGAITLLENYPDIREYYQKRYEVIIEDEAQDSSKTLQRFIQLLSRDTENLIRTGDTNQSITTTFSTADTEVFRQFIKEAKHCVKMNYSGRCAQPVMALANQWIQAVQKEPDLAHSFEPVEMHAVTGQNPDLLYLKQSPLWHANLYHNEDDEVAEVIQTILQIQETHPEASITVLLRSNEQVNRWTGLLQQAEIPAISFSSSMALNPVLQAIQNYLRLLASSGKEVLTYQNKLYEFWTQTGRLTFSSETEAWFKTIPIKRWPEQVAFQTIESGYLAQAYFHYLDHLQELIKNRLPSLIIKLTDRLFQSVSDRSQGYLCSILAEQWLHQFPESGISPLDYVLQQLELLIRSPRGKKSLEEALNKEASGFVKVMSMHKSKGQEFDVVFMPALQSDLFPHQMAKISLKENDKMALALDQVTSSLMSQPANNKLTEKANTPELIKRQKIEEETRLIYVGITRARKGLFISAHQNAYHPFRKKIQPTTPAFAFDTLAQLMQQIPTNSQTHSAQEVIHV